MLQTIDKHETQILSAQQNVLIQSGDQVAGNSRILILHIERMFTPASPLAIPSVRSFKMNRQNAEEMALRLNREEMKAENSQSWYVVVALVNGFTVLKVIVPQDWTPENEAETPPGVHSTYTNVAGKRTVKEFNRFQMDQAQETGEPITRWAIHIKPLNSEDLCYEDLEPVERELFEVFERNIDGFGESRIYERNGERYYLGRDRVTRRLTTFSVPDTINQLRTQAAGLLQAAKELDTESESEIRILSPYYYEIEVSGLEQVRIMVSEVDSEQEAKLKAQQFITLVQAQGTSERKELSADAA